MPRENNMLHCVKERQRALRRQLDKRNIHLKVLSMDSGIGYSTLLTYFPAGDNDPVNMPLSAFHALAAHVPDDLLSLLLPDELMLTRAEFHNDMEEEAHCLERLRVLHERRRGAA
jgi:hypothetical protein